MNQANHKTTKPQINDQYEPGLALPISEALAKQLMSKFSIRTLENKNISLSQSEVVVRTKSGAHWISQFLLAVIAPISAPSASAGLAFMIRRAFQIPTVNWYQASERESIALYCDEHIHH